MALATPNLLVFTQVDAQVDKTHLLKKNSLLWEKWEERFTIQSLTSLKLSIWKSKVSSLISLGSNVK